MVALLKNIVLCSCCGAECTKPQFFNGKPYGWTCIKKVAPNFKRSNKFTLWVKVDEEISKEIKHPSQLSWNNYTVVYKGITFKVRGNIYQSGYLKLVDDYKPTFKSMFLDYRIDATINKRVNLELIRTTSKGSIVMHSFLSDSEIEKIKANTMRYRI